MGFTVDLPQITSKDMVGITVNYIIYSSVLLFPQVESIFCYLCQNGTTVSRLISYEESGRGVQVLGGHLQWHLGSCGVKQKFSSFSTENLKALSDEKQSWWLINMLELKSAEDNLVIFHKVIVCFYTQEISGLNVNSKLKRTSRIECFTNPRLRTSIRMRAVMIISVAWTNK